MICCCFSSSISKKIGMAVSGLLLIGFVIAHLLGNLTIFLGPNGINAYAAKLQHLGPLLWVARLSLLSIVGLHISLAIALVRENKLARPIGYKVTNYRESTYAARTMAVSGIIVLGYIVYHLLHFTFKKTHPEFSHHLDHLGRHDVYQMVVMSFRDPWVSGFYIFSMLLLCSHLSHGFSSLFQSLGISKESIRCKLEVAGKALALLIFIGYSSIPFCSWLGILKV